MFGYVWLCLGMFGYVCLVFWYVCLVSLFGMFGYVWSANLSTFGNSTRWTWRDGKIFPYQTRKILKQ